MARKTPMIIEMLQNWYFIDSVLLNNHAKYAITEKKDYDEYVSLKAAMMNDLNEFYNHIGYVPTNNEIPKDHKIIQENAKSIAMRSKSVTARMLENLDMIKYMRTHIKEQFSKNPTQNVEKLSDMVINERFNKMCLDNILIGEPILKCENKDKISDFKGEILEQSYLTVRTDMVKLAKKYNMREAMDDSSGNVLGFALAGSAAKAVDAFLTRCESRCDQMRLNDSVKKACTLKCKIKTQQKIVSIFRQSAAHTNDVHARNKYSRDVKRAQIRTVQYQRQLAKITHLKTGFQNKNVV